MKENNKNSISTDSSGDIKINFKNLLNKNLELINDSDIENKINNNQSNEKGKSNFNLEN